MNLTSKYRPEWGKVAQRGGITSPFRKLLFICNSAFGKILVLLLKTNQIGLGKIRKCRS